MLSKLVGFGLASRQIPLWKRLRRRRSDYVGNAVKYLAPSKYSAFAAIILIPSIVAAPVEASISPEALGCDVSAEYPHWSSGAGSVIYKTRVTCGSAGIVEFQGTLLSGGATGQGAVRATNSQSQTLSSAGTVTFYTPRVNSSNVSCSSSSYYWGSGSAAGTAYQTPRVRVNCP